MFDFEPEASKSHDPSNRISIKGLVRAIFPRKTNPDWHLDTLSFRPLNDRPSPVSGVPSADGPIATIARIELNAKNGLPLDYGLPPNALNQPDAP